jgi:hypothetical protein
MAVVFIPKRLTVEEVDGNPSGIISKLIVSSGTLSINDGQGTLNVPCITSGTAAPSGGSDGDIYLQYTP